MHKIFLSIEQTGYSLYEANYAFNPTELHLDCDNN